MKNSNSMRWISVAALIFGLVAVLLASPAPVHAQDDGSDDQIVLGGRFRLQSNETLDGDLIILGGTAVLESGSTVTGSVLLTGGTLEAAGTIEGDITAFGGTISLMNNAVVEGDVVLNSVNFNQSPNAVVEGDVRNNVGFEGLDLPNIQAPQQVYISPFRTWVDFLTSVIWWVVRTLAIAGLGALVVLIAPQPTARVAASISAQPVIASAFGLLTAIVAPALLVLLTITLILIPVALIGILILAVAGLFGWIAVGYEIGLRLQKALKQNWASALSAGIGTLLLTLVASIFGIIPCIGWVVWALVSMVGLGGVLISRFGTQVYGHPAAPRSDVLAFPTTERHPIPGEDAPGDAEPPVTPPPSQ